MQRILYFIFLLFAFSSNALAENKDKGEQKNTLKLQVGGYIDSQVGHANQRPEYSGQHLPNQHPGVTSPAANGVNNVNSDAQTRTNSRIDLKIIGKTKSGLKYGGAVVTTTSLTHSDDENGYPGNQNFVFIDSKAGKVEAGAMYSSASRMRVDSSLISRATGGATGDWWRYTNYPVFDTAGLSGAEANELSMAFRPIFLLQPMLPNEAGFSTGLTMGNFGVGGAPASFNSLQPKLGWGSLSNKISYYTPRMNGFQFGLSYSPDTGSYGSLNGNQSPSAMDPSGNRLHYGGRGGMGTGDVRDLITLGVNYAKQIDNLAILLSFTMEKGKAESVAQLSNGYSCYASGLCSGGYVGREDLLAYAYGINLAYSNLTFAASYGSWGKSLNMKANYAKDGDGNYLYPELVPTDSSGNLMNSFGKTDFYTAGITYNFGPINLSVTRFESNHIGNKVKTTSIGTDFRIGDIGPKRGIVPYIEYTMYDMTARNIFLHSTSRTYNAPKNSGYVLITGIKLIF